jgi:hypothetical protein
MNDHQGCCLELALSTLRALNDATPKLTCEAVHLGAGAGFRPSVRCLIRQPS